MNAASSGPSIPEPIIQPSGGLDFGTLPMDSDELDEEHQWADFATGSESLVSPGGQGAWPFNFGGQFYNLDRELEAIFEGLLPAESFGNLATGQNQPPSSVLHADVAQSTSMSTPAVVSQGSILSHVVSIEPACLPGPSSLTATVSLSNPHVQSDWEATQM